MTVQQHAPRLEQVRPPVVISNGIVVATAVIVVLGLAIVAVYTLLQGATPTPAEFEVVEKLQRLRETIPGGFI